MSESNINVAAELARLKEENDKLRAMNALPRDLISKVSEKGAISLYGIGRFPATFYTNQWLKIKAWVNSPEFNAAIEDPKAKRI
jgi:hypothetical protein